MLSRARESLEGRWLHVAVLFHVLAALILLPVAAHPFDLAVLTGNAEAWLRWGVSPFYQWKFGADYAAVAVLAQSLRMLLEALGIAAIPAIHVSWKILLLASDLLAAAFLYRLALRIAPHKAVLLASLWLVNPVVLWVSAGHGQAECLALMFLFASLDALAARRFLLAGILTGFATGIEFFPLVATICVAVWALKGLVSWKSTRTYLIGVLASLALCFSPAAFDAVARDGLAGGLTSSAGLDVGAAPSLLSVWVWLGPQFSRFWPVLFGLSCLVWFAISLKREGNAAGILAVSGVLFAALFWDANTLPQFAAIAVAGLLLLALVAPVEPLLIQVLPLAGLATYFFFIDFGNSTAMAFFFDDWFRSGGAFWQPPQSQNVASLLGRLFVAGTAGVYVYALISRSTVRRPGWRLAFGLGAMAILAVDLWAAQPDIWRGLASNAPDLPAFGSTAAARKGNLQYAGSDSFEVTYPTALIEAADHARVSSANGLRVQFDDLVSSQSVGQPQPASAVNGRSLVVPNWNSIRTSIKAVWVEVLLGSASWSTAAPPTNVKLTVNGKQITPSMSPLVASKPGFLGWRRVAFLVQSSSIEPDGELRLSLSPTSLLWNGSVGELWLRVVPAQGSVPAVADGTQVELHFNVDVGGAGYLTGLPTKKTVSVRLLGPPSMLPSVLGAALVWPSGQRWTVSWIWLFIGGLYAALVLGLTIWLYLRLTRLREDGSRGWPTGTSLSSRLWAIRLKATRSVAS